MKTFWVAMIALTLVACGDDSSKTANNANDNNTSENNNNNDFTALGSWTLTIDGNFINGGRVDPYYDENEDLLSVAMTNGPAEFKNLIFEIPGQNYDSKGTFTLLLNEVNVTGGGDDYRCGTHQPDGDFAITIGSISATAVNGSFSGTLSCDEGVFTVTGAFGR